MERVEVGYGFCPECMYPVYIIAGDNAFQEFHNEECTQVRTPVPCMTMSELDQTAELLYLFIRPNLN